MAAPSVSHPSLSDLQAFGVGRLPLASAETVQLHLETCLDCQRAVAESSGDSFLARLRAAQAGDRSGATDQPFGGRPKDGAGVAPPDPSPSSATPPIAPELATNSEYEVVRELGRGGMGIVYLARNTLMGRDEVLKVMGRDVMSRPGAVERFKREIQAAARLDHANIVRAYSARQFGEQLVLTMEYVPGEELGALVKVRGPLPVMTACYYVQQVANGLQHAHEKGMAHRDIKPANLIRVVRGKKHAVKILDFGLAKLTAEGGDADLTGTGQMMGTPHYMAPEQASDASRADIRADVYSLGCTLYFLLTGAPPFPASSIYDLIRKHREELPPALDVVRPEVPGELAAVAAKMMAKDPAQRYQTPAEVARALSPFILKSSPGAAISPEPAQSPRPPRLATPVLPVARPPVGVPTGTRRSSGGPAGSDAAVDNVPAKAWETVLPDSDVGDYPEREPGPRKRRNAGAAIAIAAVLAACSIILLAAAALRLKTKEGVIVVENVPPGADVVVEGETITVTRQGEETRVSLAHGGPHRLKILMGKSILYSNDVTVTIGGAPVRVRVEADGIGGPVLQQQTTPLPSKGQLASPFTIPSAMKPLPPADRKGKGLKPGEVWTNPLGMKFAFVPAGSFWMGGGEGTPGEKSTTIPDDFYLGIYLVTQGEWGLVMNANPSHFSRRGSGADKVRDVSDSDLDRFPVENVSWDDAQEFIKRLNARDPNDGWQYRIPTEEEWEYACRGAASTKADCAFSFYFAKPTNDLSSDQANFDGNTPAGKGSKGIFRERTTKVGSFEANPLGLFDMHGNVLQFCKNYDNKSGGPLLTVRGGCWYATGINCQAGTHRPGTAIPPSLRRYHIGFRVALAPKR